MMRRYILKTLCILFILPCLSIGSGTVIQSEIAQGMKLIEYDEEATLVVIEGGRVFYVLAYLCVNFLGF